MKVLNLDKLTTKEERKLILGGVSHPVQAMTVSNFIETTKAAERIAAEDSLAVQIEETVKMIIRSVPTVTATALNALSLTDLQTIVAFVRGDDIDGVETEASQEGTPAGN